MTKIKNKIPEDHQERLRMIGTIAREYRWSTGMTQREFAKAANISRTSLQTLERGGNTTLETVLKFADMADTDIEELFWQVK